MQTSSSLSICRHSFSFGMEQTEVMLFAIQLNARHELGAYGVSPFDDAIADVLSLGSDAQVLAPVVQGVAVDVIHNKSVTRRQAHQKSMEQNRARGALAVSFSGIDTRLRVAMARRATSNPPVAIFDEFVVGVVDLDRSAANFQFH